MCDLMINCVIQRQSNIKHFAILAQGLTSQQTMQKNITQHISQAKINCSNNSANKMLWLSKKNHIIWSFTN